MTDEIEIQDAGNLRHYRTETPNIVFELGLTPFELALYQILRRTTGGNPNGVCWKATETLAKESCMSAGMIGKAKAGLLKPHALLDGKALITLTKKTGAAGRARDVISLTDIWPENMEFYSRKKQQKQAAQSSHSDFQSSHSDFQSSHSDFQSSPHEPKKEPIKKELNKEEERAPEKSDISENLESPLAKAIKQICKKGIVLGYKDAERMKHVLFGLSKENATPEHVLEFGRKCSQHWCGRDKLSLKPRAPAISNVLSCWHEVLSLEEAVPAEEFISFQELAERTAKY